MKKYIIFMMMIILVVTLTSCTQNYKPTITQPTPAPTVLPTGQEYVNPEDIKGDYVIVDNPDDEYGTFVPNGGSSSGMNEDNTTAKYTINYYIDGELFHSEKAAKAYNYYPITNKVILGWYTVLLTVPDSTFIFDFSSKIEQDTDLYAISISLEKFLDMYFESEETSVVYLFGNITDDKNLCIEKTDKKISFNGVSTQNEGRYILKYNYNYYTYLDNDYKLYSCQYSMWDFIYGESVTHIDYSKSLFGIDDPYAIHNNDYYWFSSKYSCDDIIYKSIINNYNSDENSKSIMDSFKSFASEYLFSFIISARNDYYKSSVCETSVNKLNLKY